MSRTEYRVETRAGALAFTAASRDIAVRWARDNADRLPGLSVFEVITPPPIKRRIAYDLQRAGNVVRLGR